MIYTTSSPSDTQAIGEAYAHELQGGDIILLFGDLGAGKTTLVKGLAQGLGVTENITSPTFSLMNVYTIPQHPSATTLAHFDTYRLDNPADFIQIGALDYLGEKNTISIIEWPEKILPLLTGKNSKNITLQHQDDNRVITIKE